MMIQEMTSLAALAPTGLLCELMEMPEKSSILTLFPKFGWVVNDRMPNAKQTAYRIMVATTPELLARKTADLWDSGKCLSDQSLHVPYAGSPLNTETDYYWSVCTWNRQDDVGAWSAPQQFHIGAVSESHATARYPLEQTYVEPVKVVRKGDGHYFFDFGKAAFGTISFEFGADVNGGVVEVHLGEDLASEHTVQRNPKGSIRYRKMMLPLHKGETSYTVTIPPDERNTGIRAIPMPKAIGEVLPFRYCEIIGAPVAATAPQARMIMAHYVFDDEAADFRSSDTVLNEVWELCKYSIKATSFCGLYVDGDRERIPYEADAYINQLSHYAVDREFTMARLSHEYLIVEPTSPTEWLLHSVLMAWADYEYTGNTDSLVHFYEDLKAKTLLALAREDGLISTKTGLVTDAVRDALHFGVENRKLHADIGDIVDWPSAEFLGGQPGERDGYEMVAINTVVNAFHFRALVLMAKIAAIVGKLDESQELNAQAEKVKASFNTKLFDRNRGVYTDGEGSTHASLHANMFPLAFGLVPAASRQSVIAFIKSRGMACSVYGAQYLLEALYEYQEDQYALDLMTEQGDRGWWNMIQAGSTVTLEAWDWKYKNNLDWNHAWGSAPANIIPRFLMGVRPLEAGFGKILIQPQPGNLQQAALRLPTIRGDVSIQFAQAPEGVFSLEITLPANVTARVMLPLPDSSHAEILLDGQVLDTMRDGCFAAVDPVGSGHHRLECRQR